MFSIWLLIIKLMLSICWESPNRPRLLCTTWKIKLFLNLKKYLRVLYLPALFDFYLSSASVSYINEVVSYFITIIPIEIKRNPAVVAWGKSACFIRGMTLICWIESRFRHVFIWYHKWTCFILIRLTMGISVVT